MVTCVHYTVHNKKTEKTQGMFFQYWKHFFHKTVTHIIQQVKMDDTPIHIFVVSMSYLFKKKKRRK